MPPKRSIWGSLIGEEQDLAWYIRKLIFERSESWVEEMEMVNEFSCYVMVKGHQFW
jgi:hypothetical protein